MTQSVIDQAINKAVAVGIGSYHVSFLRRNGGIPINPTGENYERAVHYVNAILQDRDKPDGAPVVDVRIAQNAVDLLAVLNAQSHESDEAVKTTLALFTTLADLPKQAVTPAVEEVQMSVTAEQSEQS